jgi:hypothetical protein
VRLDVLEHGHKAGARAFLGAVRLMSRREPPSVLKTLTYRPGMFGRDFSAVVQHALRGPSYWSVGERELFAAYTSRLNQCPF